MPPIRLLPFAAASGAGNMARDEALLLSAADRGVASLRFYTWTEPTVSLGYFQPAAERLPELAYVRRATGGAAIVHDPPTEITYSLALPPGPHWQPPGESWICRMHYFVRDVLRAKWGVTAKAVVCGEEQKLGPVLCFLHHTPGDLVVEARVRFSEQSKRFFYSPRRGEVADSSGARTAGEGHCGVSPPHPRSAAPSLPSPQRGEGENTLHKIAGSAQRKWKGALLQHGSILLARSPFAPQLPGVTDLTGVSIDRHHLAAAVVEHFTTQTGWAIEPGDWTADELAHADRTTADKYAAADWNEKR
jgi:lipoate-protein ligase A